MVSFTVYKPNTGGAYVEGVCLATDEKPIAGITNGSILFAVDTTDGSMTRYMFDQSAGEWIETECPCSGGGSGGSGLPEVDSEDNGDVLTVVDGAWGKAAPSGGGAYFITPTVDGETMTFTESYDDIKALLDAGTMVYLRMDYEIPDVVTSSSMLPLWTVSHDSDGYWAEFFKYEYGQLDDNLVISTYLFTAATATASMSLNDGSEPGE